MLFSRIGSLSSKGSYYWCNVVNFCIILWLFWRCLCSFFSFNFSIQVWCWYIELLFVNVEIINLRLSIIAYRIRLLRPPCWVFEPFLTHLLILKWNGRRLCFSSLINWFIFLHFSIKISFHKSTCLFCRVYAFWFLFDLFFKEEFQRLIRIYSGGWIFFILLFNFSGLIS